MFAYLIFIKMIMQTASTQSYACRDLGLTAALLCLPDNELVDIDLSDWPKATFELSWHRQLEKQVQGYWASKLQVDAHTYFNQLKRLKAQLYSKY